MGKKVPGPTTAYREICYFIKNLVEDDEMKAQEMADRCFLKLWQCSKSISNIEHLKNWLYLVARNLVRDHWKCKRVMKGFLNGIPYSRMAVEMQVNPKTVRSQYQRGVKLLQQKLKGK